MYSRLHEAIKYIHVDLNDQNKDHKIEDDRKAYPCVDLLHHANNCASQSLLCASGS